MKAYKCVIIMFICLFVLLSTGCHSTNEEKKIDELTRTILKDEFNEEYSHYEDTLNISNDSKKIVIIANISSGTINLNLLESTSGESINHEYQIDQPFKEIIELGNDHSNEWTAIVDFDKDTDGSYSISIYE